MRCVHCDYLLFNLSGQNCPECGNPFNLEQYRFEPGAVSFQCPHCDQDYYGNDERGLPFPRSFICVGCRQPLTLNQLRVVPRISDASGLPCEPSPWDRRSELGTASSWWQTVKWTMMQPTRFYRSHGGQSTREAWLFSLITLYVGMLPACLYSIGILWGVTKLVTAVGPPGAAPATMPLPFGVMAGLYVVQGLISPLIAPIITGAIWTILIHPVLFLLAPRRKSMGHTLRLSLYSFGPYALFIIPIFGPYVGSVWQLVTMVIGIREVHETTGWRASLAVLWPVLALLGIYVAVVATIFLQPTAPFVPPIPTGPAPGPTG